MPHVNYSEIVDMILDGWGFESESVTKAAQDEGGGNGVMRNHILARIAIGVERLARHFAPTQEEIEIQKAINNSNERRENYEKREAIRDAAWDEAAPLLNQRHYKEFCDTAPPIINGFSRSVLRGFVESRAGALADKGEYVAKLRAAVESFAWPDTWPDDVYVQNFGTKRKAAYNAWRAAKCGERSDEPTIANNAAIV